MYPEIDLSSLPSLPFLNKDLLPHCSAIYFLLDSQNRVLYIGQATNLCARWKDHHRFEQLQKLNRKSNIRIAWLVCENDKELLDKTERYFIDLYQPLLNKTPVPAKKIIPSEIALQKTLIKLSKLNVIILGIALPENSSQPTVYLKYPVLGRRGLSGTVSSIFKSDNRATCLRWKKYDTRYKFNFWETRCNGITIDVAPFDGLVFVLERTKIQKLLEVEMLCLKDPEFKEIVELWPFMEQQPPGLSILEQDPIPRLWTNLV
ncbi:GIY-YIG nuclease family protein [Limnoraphis robusta]|uniref:GIY-YIG nuclease family protein n=1 Tax=Limnoraphis robusta CCNP1315 TaxID=3110306 RepID=A0ABU5TSK7_9CYAN|nr:GIY-YIG nuclease family protein [Limnoraphis robusta]MEA5517856.1 GIY-YIG nuclease family protein [Limnoraphis robusta CCNP1315]MEA5546338.1 GIY-YIG nuclease family protein [Limnoraphis robusta CCNP1324]